MPGADPAVAARGEDDSAGVAQRAADPEFLPSCAMAGAWPGGQPRRRKCGDGRLSGERNGWMMWGRLGACCGHSARILFLRTIGAAESVAQAGSLPHTKI